MTVPENTSFDDAIELIIRHEGWHDPVSGYVGYGHKILPGEEHLIGITESQARSLVRADLMAKCAVFREYGKDSLILGTLAYNVGEGNVMRSSLPSKSRSGVGFTIEDYVSFCHISGKPNEALRKRRVEEYELLYK